MKSLGDRRRRTQTSAVALSLGFHALVLAAMVLGVRVIAPPPQSQPIILQLLPPPVLRPTPKLTPRTRGPSRPAPPAPALNPHRVAAPDTPGPPVLPPETKPAPPAASPAEANGGDGGQGFRSGLRLKLGCADPDPFHLTAHEQQVCGDKLAVAAKTAKPLAINIPEDKRAEYDRKTHCKDVYKRGAIPSSGSMDASTGQQIGGLGYNPSLRECGVGDR